MKSDLQIKSDVSAELGWDPAVRSPSVGVAVTEGIVTLSGTVDSYMRKHAVERAVRRVSGVRGIAMDLEVQLAPGDARSDAQIAPAALHALRWHSLVPDERLQVEVEDGRVTLRGELEWAYQSASAESAVRSLVGVRGVRNEIRLVPHAKPDQLRADITAALMRHAQREAGHIAIDVEGGVVTLHGQVDSLAGRDAAMGTAFAARGVSQVIDRLDITG